MPLEIERKFLLKNNNWQAQADSGTLFKQAYLNTAPERTVRVRIKGQEGFLTVKGKTEFRSRTEFEYQIPVEDAQAMLLLCERPIIEKTRYLVKADDLIWEIDIFEGVNAGLSMAEVELKDPLQDLVLPDWIGKEVTEDIRYYNSNLVAYPFSEWKENL